MKGRQGALHEMAVQGSCCAYPGLLPVVLGTKFVVTVATPPLFVAGLFPTFSVVFSIVFGGVGVVFPFVVPSKGGPSGFRDIGASSTKCLETIICSLILVGLIIAQYHTLSEFSTTLS